MTINTLKRKPPPVITDQIKGDILLYRPSGLFGWLIGHFSKFSHVALALDRQYQYHASQQHGGVVQSPIEWRRRPVIIPLPWDESAFQYMKRETLGDDYAELQVITQGLVILTGWQCLLYRRGRQCAETIGFHILKHPFFAKAVGKGWISRKLETILYDLDRLKPDHIGRAATKMAKVSGKKPLRRYIV